jgi:hypothetical protein
LIFVTKHQRCGKQTNPIAAVYDIEPLDVANILNLRSHLSNHVGCSYHEFGRDQAAQAIVSPLEARTVGANVHDPK